MVSGHWGLSEHRFTDVLNYFMRQTGFKEFPAQCESQVPGFSHD